MRGVNFADLTSEDSDDYRTCLSNSYILFYQRKNTSFVSLEHQLSQLTVSQPSQPKKQNLSIDEIDSLETEGRILEDSDYEDLSLEEDQNDVYEELIDESTDTEIEDDYFNDIIKNETIFFTFNENEKSTSGILTISNILHR